MNKGMEKLKKQPDLKRKEEAMHNRDQYSIDLLVRCPRRYCEVLSDDVIMAECVVEDLFAQVLATLFEVVCINDVSVAFPANHAEPITISLRAQGFEPAPALEHPDCTIEEKLTCALAELFDSLNVERFALI